MSVRHLREVRCWKFKSVKARQKNNQLLTNKVLLLFLLEVIVVYFRLEVYIAEFIDVLVFVEPHNDFVLILFYFLLLFRLFAFRRLHWLLLLFLDWHLN